MRVEFLWFDDCPNHEAARAMLHSVLSDLGVEAAVEDLNATSPDVADGLRFPGSPTIRVDGHDVEPGFADPGDYTPRCRLYLTPEGLRGFPKREWVIDAIQGAR